MPIKHLYFHIPFCHRICPYCSFYKHTPGDTDFKAFVDALLLDLESQAARHELRPRTLYFGGGTPTFLSRHHLDPLLNGIHSILDLTQLEEWTFEANPATFEIEKARLLRHHGVSRVSLGVQSWDPQVLHTLGRDHSPADARESFLILRQAGFENLNIDLMFAVPGQSISQWEETLRQTVALEPDHISAYNLTYEEDTEFMRRFESGEFSQSNDQDAAFFERTAAILGDAGYLHYEISNYARPDFESLHNQSYWRGADYLGIGPGAVGTIGSRRYKNIPDTREYIARITNGESAATAIEDLSSAERTNEAIALQLRTDEGLDLTRAPHLTDKEILPLVENNLLVASAGRLTLTPKGKLVADAVATHLLASPS